jgi:hypothetical protein
LVGNWFHESVSASESSRGDPAVWAKQLAFVYDVRQPKAVRVSVGGTVAPAGVYAVPSNAPDPAAVSRKTGLVKYSLLNPNEGNVGQGLARGDSLRQPRLLLLVQLLDESKLKVESFPGQAPEEIDGFSDAASLYLR